MTVTAIPDPGYLFVNWTLNGAVVSTDSIYTFVMDTVNVDLVAHLEEITAISESDTEGIRVVYESATGQLYLDTPLTVSEASLFDLNGKHILSETGGKESFTLNMNGLKKGVYIVRLTTREGFIIRKLLI
ncbi:MAG: T9SS type A sorting domain-containing protein [Bacteroidales bacterium]|nr:T9SS type A sorting domain-containing protein [Bacteroidales bacterium]